MITILSWLEDWIRGLLTDGIVSNLSSLFETVNAKVGEISGDIGATPQGWNSSIYTMIHTLSENIIIPIAGVILAFVMTLELIQLVTEKNHLHNDVDVWMFFKWIFKTACAILILTNTWNIVMGIFDVAHSVVNDAAGIIAGSTNIDIGLTSEEIRAMLNTYSVGSLFGLWFQSLFVGISVWALTVCIFLVTYGRMIEIYLVTSVAPIPMATMLHRESGGMGQNYIRSLFALAFQAFLMIVCVAIYAVLVRNIASASDISYAMWTCMGYTVLLCFTLFKTGSLSKSIFSAH